MISPGRTGSEAAIVADGSANQGPSLLDHLP
jgi:hypothetical protein